MYIMMLLAAAVSKAPTPAPTQQQQQEKAAELARLSAQQQQTAGAKPLPKVSKGSASWKKSKTAWYPDRSGILHAPG
jgi:type II secretory pathway pseudopilin PulG